MTYIQGIISLFIKILFMRRDFVADLSAIFNEVDQCPMADVIEYPSLVTKSSSEFKNALKHRISQFKNEYDLDQGLSVVLKKSNDIDFLIDMLALFFLGVTTTPIDPETPTNDVENILNASMASLLIEPSGVRVLNQRMVPEFMGISLLLFTSGTTGDPKGVMIGRAELMKKWRLLSENIPIDQMENTLCFVPTFFGHGLICNCLFPFFYGKKLVLAKKMNLELAKDFSDVINKFQINFFSSVPSHWNLILEFSGTKKLNSLKRVHCASSPLRSELARSVSSWLGEVQFFDVYGATEMLGWFALRKVNKNGELGSFDNFWEVEKKYSDSSELLLKSEYMFSGYWINHKSIASEYFNTGDIFQENLIKGRTKNVINKNGMKISAEDVIIVLLRSELVTDAAVVALPDQMTGERVGAIIVLKENAQIKNLKEYIQTSFSEQMRPSELIAVEKIPTNARGKVSSIELIKLFEVKDLTSEDVLGVFNKIFKTNYQSVDIPKADVSSWDSMRHAELVIALQKKFGIKFEAKDIVQVENLNQLSKIINQKSLRRS
jgi:acyl-coenzyme A synthetase/AMP-(fatty) acid ligase/acyl carrier protein